MSNDIVLYSKITSLRNRLEMGQEYTKKQIEEAIALIDKINVLLDRRKGAK